MAYIISSLTWMDKRNPELRGISYWSERLLVVFFDVLQAKRKKRREEAPLLFFILICVDLQAI